jgi:uncharacterized protein YhaN
MKYMICEQMQEALDRLVEERNFYRDKAREACEELEALKKDARLILNFAELVPRINWRSIHQEAARRILEVTEES